MDQTKSPCPAYGSPRVVPVMWDIPGLEFAELEREH